MKSFNTLILLSVLAAATTSAWQVDEPAAVSNSSYFDHIVDVTIGLAKESNVHCTNNFLLALVGIRL